MGAAIDVSTIAVLPWPENARVSLHRSAVRTPVFRAGLIRCACVVPGQLAAVIDSHSKRPCACEVLAFPLKGVSS